MTEECTIKWIKQRLNYGITFPAWNEKLSGHMSGIQGLASIIAGYMNLLFIFQGQSIEEVKSTIPPSDIENISIFTQKIIEACPESNGTVRLVVRHKPDETTFYTARSLTYVEEASNKDGETVKNPSHPLFLFFTILFYFLDRGAYFGKRQQR